MLLSNSLRFPLILLYVSVNFNLFGGERISNLNGITSQEIIQKLLEFKKQLIEKTSDIKVVIKDSTPNCIQIQCKYVCFNGKSNEVALDIQTVATNSRINCEVLEELRLYNYQFPNDTLSYGFLGEYHNRIQSIQIFSSNVVVIEGGSFANGVFETIYLENLQLESLEKDFFHGISNDFKSLTVIQKDTPLKYVCEDFLDTVKLKIKQISLQVGITCIRNLTAAESLLSNLGFVDFSYNDFRKNLKADSFNKLSMVENLDLSYSNIKVLPENIFANLLSTLEYLNLSYNKLKTISYQIFGWYPMTRELRIYMNNNPWQCTCDLRLEMNQLFVYQSAVILCETPAQYSNWSVFDERLCDDTGMYDSTQGFFPETTTLTAGTAKTTIAETTKITNVTRTTTACFHCNHTTTPLPIMEDEQTVKLECDSRENYDSESRYELKVKSPWIWFSLLPAGSLSVQVLMESTERLNNSFGLIWFSKVTKQFYKMEINYNDYGLGCYEGISYMTIVTDLIPNVAYTFCLVLKEHLTVPPFSCKSIHVGGNLNVTYTAWVSRDMRATGISLTILGIVIFMFIGVFLIFMVIKRKPTLLKGSKRVATNKANANEIVVFPKDRTLHEMRKKEEMIAKRSSRSLPAFLPPRPIHYESAVHRRNSAESIDSNQSYMNANLYEMIPHYLKLNPVYNQNQQQSDGDSNSQREIDTEDDYSEVPPLRPPPSPSCASKLSNSFSALSTTSSTATLVNYAEIPFRHKRSSTDPLPAVPSFPDDNENYYALVQSKERRTGIDSDTQFGLQSMPISKDRSTDSIEYTIPCDSSV